MGSLFSKKSTISRVTQHDVAVLELKSQRDNMRQLIQRSDANIEKEKNIAKQLIRTGKKDQAFLLLKKKHVQEQIIEKTIKQLDTIDKMVGDLEFSQIEMRVVEGLKMGNQALKTIHQLISIENVEKIMDDTREAVEYQEEIDSLISGQLSCQDISDVEAELEVLLECKLDLPEIPTEPIPELHVQKEKQQRKPQRKAELLPS